MRYSFDEFLWFRIRPLCGVMPCDNVTILLLFFIAELVTCWMLNSFAPMLCVELKPVVHAVDFQSEKPEWNPLWLLHAVIVSLRIDLRLGTSPEGGTLLDPYEKSSFDFFTARNPQRTLTVIFIGRKSFLLLKLWCQMPSGLDISFLFLNKRIIYSSD